MKARTVLLLAALVAASPSARSGGAATDGAARGRIAFLAEMGGQAELRVVDVASRATTLAIGALPGQPPHWSPDGSRIVFVGLQDRHQSVMLARADGSNIEQLVRGPSFDLYPAFSPDGKSIAVVSGRDGNSEIYTIDLATRALRRLTDDPAWDSYPTWSPDGKRIAFLSGSGASAAPHALWIIGADGSGRRKVADTVAMRERPACSPAGRHIAFISTNPTGSLAVVDIQSGAVRRLADHGENLAWSPDGARLAFKGAGVQVMVVGEDGTGLTDLTHNGRFNGYPAWSPDGARIAFVSGGCQSPFLPCFDKNHELYVMRKDGSRTVKLTRGVQWATFPEWSP